MEKESAPPTAPDYSYFDNIKIKKSTRYGYKSVFNRFIKGGYEHNADGIDEFLSDLKAKGCLETTIVIDRNILCAYLGAIPARNLDKLSAEDPQIEKFIEENNIQEDEAPTCREVLKSFLSDGYPYTKHGIRQWIKNATNQNYSYKTIHTGKMRIKQYLIYRGYKIPENLYSYKNKTKTPTPTDEQITAGINRINNTHHRAVLWLIYHTGISLTKLTNLPATAWDKDKHEIFISENYRVPLNQEAENILHLFHGEKYIIEVRRGRKISHNRILNAFNEELNMPLTILRHAYIRRLRKASISEEQIRLYMGVSAENIRQTYAK